MRKLVTIRKISSIIEIKDCTEIALGVVDGWSVIIKKSEFKIGDTLCASFELTHSFQWNLVTSS